MKSMPYLLQRGTIRHDVANGKLSDCVKFDYMGYAEYEFGALPASLRRLQKTSPAHYTCSNIVTSDGTQLHLMGSFESDDDFRQYSEALRVVAANRGTTKGFSGLSDALKGSREVSLPHRRMTREKREQFIKDTLARRSNFWWDIENDVMFSTSPEFMQRLPAVLAASFAVMDSPATENARIPTTASPSIATGAPR